MRYGQPRLCLSLSVFHNPTPLLLFFVNVAAELGGSCLLSGQVTGIAPTTFPLAGYNIGWDERQEYEVGVRLRFKTCD